MSMGTAKMPERGQIIIPKEVREQIHADTNTIFVTGKNWDKLFEIKLIH